MSLYTELHKAYTRVPQALALVEKGKSITYETLLERIDVVAGALDYSGIKSGDHAGLLCFNQTEYIELFFALNKLGAVAVSINPMQPAELLKFIFEDSGIKMLFVENEFYRAFSAIFRKRFTPAT